MTNKVPVVKSAEEVEWTAAYNAWIHSSYLATYAKKKDQASTRDQANKDKAEMLRLTGKLRAAQAKA